MHIDNHGLYRDDGLMVELNRSRENYNIRKKLVKLFKDLEMYLKVVQYVDIKMDLVNKTQTASYFNIYSRSKAQTTSYFTLIADQKPKQQFILH